MAVSTRKADLRKEVLQRRASMPFEVASRLGLVIQEKLCALPEFVEAKRLALYSGLGTEVRTDLLLSRAFALQKEVSFPRVDRSVKGGALIFIKVESAGELSPGFCGVSEPSASGVEVDRSKLDLIVVPGIVFDTAGARIGYGKGYYDRVLKGMECIKVALAYDMQVSESPIPTEAHDVNVDLIVTESRVMRIEH